MNRKMPVVLMFVVAIVGAALFANFMIAALPTDWFHK